MDDVHQALDWVNALSEAGSDDGEVSGLSDVSSADSASAFIIIQHYYLRQGGYVIAWVCVCVRYVCVCSLRLGLRCYFTACHKVPG